MLCRCLLSLTTFGIISAGELRALQRAPERCDQYQAAVQADPNNVDAAARLGSCSFRDYEMIALGGDSSRMVFRSSWSTALRALRHAVELDRGYSRAYQPLFNILFAETRDGCSSVTGECNYVSPVVRSGDSVLTIPRRVMSGGPDLNPYDGVVRESQTTRRANLTEARAIAERWVPVAPQDRRPHEYLGKALLRLGDPVAATAELETAARLGTAASRRALFWDRMEALVMSDRGDDARRVLDEAVNDPARDTTSLRGYTVAGLNALLGRYRPPLDTSARDRELRARQRARIDSIIRTNPPMPPRPSASVSDLVARGDRSGALRELARQDSIFAPMNGARRFPRVDERVLYSAQQHLALGDTTGAEARLSEIERALTEQPFRYNAAMAYGPGAWMGRAWLLTGDVAAARGRREEASSHVSSYHRAMGWGRCRSEARRRPRSSEVGVPVRALRLSARHDARRGLVMRESVDVPSSEHRGRRRRCSVGIAISERPGHLTSARRRRAEPIRAAPNDTSRRRALCERLDSRWVRDTHRRRNWAPLSAHPRFPATTQH